MENLETKSKEILEIILKALSELEDPKEQIKILYLTKMRLINKHMEISKELNESIIKHNEYIEILKQQI
jgi:hypothetical protein